jgi:transposase-like protein
MYEDYPRSLLEFEERFETDEACRKYLCQLRWPEGFVCVECEGSDGWRTRRGLYHCKQCGQQMSPTAGTIFHRTRLPLRLWFRSIWHITNQKYGANALGMQRVLGLGSYQTAWEWLHKLRRAMVRPNREHLSGIVEVDETYIGGRKTGKRGRGAEGKCLVAIAIELKGKKLGRVRLRHIADASSNELNGFVQRSVLPGSTIQTDGWSGYSQLPQNGYVHEITSSRSDPEENDDNLLPHVHLIASLLKRWLLGTYHGAVCPTHLDYYLDEYTFRFNRRASASRGKLFFRLMQQAVEVSPVTREQLKKG